jgi:ceramide glucosyltransferase
MFAVLRWTVLIVALAPLAYYLIALYCSWEYFRAAKAGTQPSNSPMPPASILKPVRGVDRDAYDNFSSFCALDYPQYEILFAVADADDPVLPVLRKLQAEYSNVPIRVLTDIPQIGANRKINNLCRLAAAARYDLLVISDSDVRVAPEYLRQVAAAFSNGNVGASTSFFRGHTQGTLGAELEALVLATETVPNALLARKMEGRVKFAFGWTMAVTRESLRAIGGFESMADYHSDDFELGNRIAAKGMRIALLPEPVTMIFPRETFAEFARHELRWAIGLRNVRPSGYVGLLLTFGLPWAIAAALLAPNGFAASAYLGAYLVLRIALVLTIGAGLRDEVALRSWWLTPLRDAINFAIWLAGFFTSTIRWRGVAYRVKHGKLVPERNAAPGR